VKSIHDRVPDCRVLFVAVKPSLMRWAQYGTQTKANVMVREVCQKSERLAYVDIVTPMLGRDGKPMPELFVKDGLHLSAEGYRIWAKVVGEQLKGK
jgi:lysophospholipase L1-like esterase